MTVNILMVLLAALLGGFFWRVRGGFIGTGSTQLARLLGTAPLAVALFLFTGDWRGAAVGALLWPPLFLPWAAWIDMGTVRGRVWTDALMTTLRGIAQTALPAAGLYLLTDPAPLAPAVALALSGAAMGPIYLATNHVPALKRLRLGAFSGDAIAHAEVLMGAWLYGCITAAVLLTIGPAAPS